MKISRSGFTIVELLITIVVIAILATISVVAYNGAQERARTSAVQSAVSQWNKLILLANSTNDRAFKAGTSFGPGITARCLGRSAADFPAKDGFMAGECMTIRTGDATVNFMYDSNSYNNWPSELQRPNGLLPITTYSYGPGEGARARGVVGYDPVEDTTGNSFAIYWVSQLNGECQPGEPQSAESPAGQLGGRWCALRSNY